MLGAYHLGVLRPKSLNDFDDLNIFLALRDDRDAFSLIMILIIVLGKASNLMVAVIGKSVSAMLGFCHWVALHLTLVLKGWRHLSHFTQTL